MPGGRSVTLRAWELTSNVFNEIPQNMRPPATKRSFGYAASTRLKACRHAWADTWWGLTPRADRPNTTQCVKLIHVCSSFVLKKYKERERAVLSSPNCFDFVGISGP